MRVTTHGRDGGLPLGRIGFPMIDASTLNQGEGFHVPRITAPIQEVFEIEYLERK